MSWNFVAGLMGLKVGEILSLYTDQGHLLHAHQQGSYHHQIQTKVKLFFHINYICLWMFCFLMIRPSKWS